MASGDRGSARGSALISRSRRAKVAPAVTREIDQHLERVRLRRAVDSIPSTARPPQRGLQQILGVPAIACEQIRGAQQPRRRAHHELSEVVVGSPPSTIRCTHIHDYSDSDYVAKVARRRKLEGSNGAAHERCSLSVPN